MRDEFANALRGIQLAMAEIVGSAVRNVFTQAGFMRTTTSRGPALPYPVDRNTGVGPWQPQSREFNQGALRSRTRLLVEDMYGRRIWQSMDAKLSAIIGLLGKTDPHKQAPPGAGITVPLLGAPKPGVAPVKAPPVWKTQPPVSGTPYDRLTAHIDSFFTLARCVDQRRGRAEGNEQSAGGQEDQAGAAAVHDATLKSRIRQVKGGVNPGSVVILERRTK